MNLIFRTLLMFLISPRRSKLDAHDVGVSTYHVLPTDLDILGHMNNGVYFSIMDLGRFDLMIRAGVWQKLRSRGWYPVMQSETMTFRKSLQPWQRFDVESRIAGYDAKAIYMEQRFVVKGEIYASAMTRARFLKKEGGTVSMQELADLTGIDPTTLPAPAWVEDWSANVALPAAKGSAPSVWE